MFINVRDVYWGFSGYESSFWRTSYPPEVVPLLDYNHLWKNDLRNDRSLTPERVQVVEGVSLGSNLIPSIFIIVLF